MVGGSERAVVFLLVVSVTLVGAVPAHGHSEVPDRNDEPASLDGVSPIGDKTIHGLQRTDPNNSSVRHERRERLDESGDLGRLQQWFTRSLGAQLEQSVVTLEQGEYERARSLLGDSYDDKLGRYVDIAGETDDDEDDSSAGAFESAQQSQQDYAESVQEYRDTYEDYQEAKQSGNETRARVLARDLNQLSNRIQRTGTSLSENYSRITAQTQVNLSEATRTVTNITKSIATQQETIRRESFTNTTLTITQLTSTASFRSPIQVSGQLQAANGTRLSDRRVVLSFGERTVRTRTTDNGSFQFAIRPKLESLGRQSVTLQYVPRETGIYLGTTTTVPVNITQTTPTVVLMESSGSASFNQTVSVRGHVHYNTVNVPRVPVRVTIGDTVLGTTRTTANGSFTFQTRLPASVSAGNQTLDVRLPLEDQALARASNSSSIQIASTPTALTLTEQANASGQQSVTLEGRLTTTDGVPIASESVQLRVGNRTVGTVSTNRTGVYEEQIAASTLADVQQRNNSSILVTAVYPGDGNLEDARTQAFVDVPDQLQAGGTGGEPGTGTSSSTPWWSNPLWLGLGGLTVLVLLGGVGLYWYRTTREGESPTSTDSTEESVGSDGEQSVGDSRVSVGRRLYEQSVEQLDAGQTDAAVKAAYAGVRRQTIDVLGWDAQSAISRTYWEFYNAATDEDALTDAQRTALKRLTEFYEEAQFTSPSMTVERANEAVTTAAEFLETFDSTHSDSAD